MSAPQSGISLRFLPWDQPWLRQLTSWLTRDWNQREALDLTRVLAIVPTRQSGRRFREALAGHTAAFGQAVFAPRVVTLEAFVGQASGKDTATRMQALLAWTAVLQAIELDEFRAVFPIDPPVRDFPWALRLAQEFSRLQVTLGEAGLRMADVPVRAGPDFVEAERWQQLGKLERGHDATLERMGTRSAHAARLALLSKTERLADFDRVLVLATPDLSRFGERWLTAIAESCPVEILVFAPETERSGFDAVGRPRPEAWEARILSLESFKERVHLCSDPAEQASRMSEVAGVYSAPEGKIAFGVADPEVAPLLENELRRRSVPVFNPEGRAARGTAFVQLLGELAALDRTPVFDHVERLARCPYFFQCVASEAGAKFAVAGWLAGLDMLRARHLPADLTEATQRASLYPRYAELAFGLQRMNEVREALRAGSFSASVVETLRILFAKDPGDDATAEEELSELSTQWMEVMQEIAEVEPAFPALRRADWWDLALRSFGERSLSAEKPSGALELQGWLELLWEDAPHLAVAGMNDGRVPEAIIENAFLPDSLRQRLGLAHNATRFARDAYQLAAMTACRAAGRVDLLLGKTAASGDPLRPSRLLLRCADDELPERIAWLFRPVTIQGSNLAWTRSWKLEPRRVAPPERVAVTALRRYLSCPFRFYLKTVLAMESVDPLKSELDAFDFGTLCHGALEQIGREPILRECTEPTVLRAELLRHFDQAVVRRYGAELSLPLLVQVESGRQRLSRLAELQAEERAAGWVTIEVERPFELNVSGLLVRGKIDRIDRHLETGNVRVIDYKTSDTAVNPAEAHLRGVRAGESVLPWAEFMLRSRPMTWIDLQLPMYLRALETEYPGHLQCGYFNLPRAAGETALTIWTDYTLELQNEAMRCAAGVCDAIRAGTYWPPNETLRPEFDDCATLFHHGVEASVGWRE